MYFRAVVPKVAEAKEVAQRINSKYTRADTLTAIRTYEAIQTAQAVNPQLALVQIQLTIKDNPFPEAQIADQAVAIAKVAASI